MIKITDKTRCFGCFACVNVCPCKCISIRCDDMGCLYPEADDAMCIGCEKCEDVCPALNHPSNTDNITPETYAAYNKKRDIQMKSSSGGLFHALADTVIASGGVVIGAAFDRGMNLIHQSAETFEQLAPLMGSKYLQSDILPCLDQIAALIESGRQVLFCGTPCQCAAVKNTCVSDKLVTASVICHGVPSPLLWEEYLRRCSDSHESEVIGCNMRDKRGGWVNYNITTDYKNGERKSLWHVQDPYFAAYMSGEMMRPCCSSCLFKGDDNVADIVLGDLWGAEKICGDFTNYTGMSAVIVRTRKGEALLTLASSKLNMKKVSYDMVASENKMLTHSARMQGNGNISAKMLMDKYSVSKITLLQRAAKFIGDIKFKRDVRKK